MPFYDQFPDLPSRTELYERTEKNVLFLIGAITFVVVGIAQYFVFQMTAGEPRFSMVSIAMVMYFLFVYTKTVFTVIPTDKINVQVVNDEKHDSGLDELYKRRHAVLRDRFGEIDRDNYPDHELFKFKWLLSENVITEAEFEAIRIGLTGSDPKPEVH